MHSWQVQGVEYPLKNQSNYESNSLKLIPRKDEYVSVQRKSERKGEEKAVTITEKWSFPIKLTGERAPQKRTWKVVFIKK